MKLGLTRYERLTACQAEVVQCGSAYGGYGLVTILYAGALLNGIYDRPTVKYDGWRAKRNGPFGAKEASEGPLSGFLSALAGAIEDATGRRFTTSRSPMPMCSMHCSKPAAGGPAR